MAKSPEVTWAARVRGARFAAGRFALLAGPVREVDDADGRPEGTFLTEGVAGASATGAASSTTGEASGADASTGASNGSSGAMRASAAGDTDSEDGVAGAAMVAVSGSTDDSAVGWTAAGLPAFAGRAVFAGAFGFVDVDFRGAAAAFEVPAFGVRGFAVDVVAPPGFVRGVERGAFGTAAEPPSTSVFVDSGGGDETGVVRAAGAFDGVDFAAPDGDAAGLAAAGLRAAGLRAAGVREAGFRGAGVVVSSAETAGSDDDDCAPDAAVLGRDPPVLGDFVVAGFALGAGASDGCPTVDASCIFWSGASWGESGSGVTGTTYQEATVYSRPRPTSAPIQPVKTPSAVLRSDNNNEVDAAPSRGAALTWAMA